MSKLSRTNTNNKTLIFKDILKHIGIYLYAYIYIYVYIWHVCVYCICIYGISVCIEKAREFQQNIYFCFVDYAKAFDCVDHKKLWKILKEMGIPDHLMCLLRNLYAGQEATVRTGHGTTDWFQIGKGVHQGCILSPCLFNLYAEFSSVQSLRRIQLFMTP